jgi:hypothetical protein
MKTEVAQFVSESPRKRGVVVSDGSHREAQLPANGVTLL